MFGDVVGVVAGAGVAAGVVVVVDVVAPSAPEPGKKRASPPRVATASRAPGRKTRWRLVGREGWWGPGMSI